MRDVTSLFDDHLPAGVTVHQITDDPGGASLVYPDIPSFLADGRRFLVHASSGPAICDPDDRYALRPLFEDSAGIDLRLTIDGRYGYYAHPQPEGSARLTVSRIALDTLRREELFHAVGTLPGLPVRADRFRVGTVSRDNRRIACGVFLGDGKTPDAPYGIAVLDLDRGEARVAAEDRDFINPHLQYCRAPEPEASHDLLVQMNHGARTDADGRCLRALGPPEDGGVDVHVVADDGSRWRDMPFGRDGRESCIGHQIWRGQGRSAVTVTLQNRDTSYGWADGSAQEVVAGWPMPAEQAAPHRGLSTPGARRVLLSAGFPHPRFCHLACDAAGLRFVFDTFPIFDGRRAGMMIYAGSAPDENSPLVFQCLLNTGVTFSANNGYHAHPIISPDGKLLLFNSNITGTPQAYRIDGFAFPGA